MDVDYIRFRRETVIRQSRNLRRITPVSLVPAWHDTVISTFLTIFPPPYIISQVTFFIPGDVDFLIPFNKVKL